MENCKLKEESFIQIKPFMVVNLNLSGNSLIIYAAIYGLTVNKGIFTGSIEYLSQWCNCSKRSVMQCIENLVDKGLIRKKRTGKGCIYISTPVDTKLPTSENSSPDEIFEDFNDEKISSKDEKSSPSKMKKVHLIGEKSSPNNIVIDSNDKLDINSLGDESTETDKSKSGSYSKTYYDQIYKAYFDNYKHLYPNSELPIINYGRLNKKIKNAFDIYGFEKVLEAVKSSVNHQFLLDRKYPLLFIFGDDELPILINKNYKSISSTSIYKNFDKSSLDGKDFFAN
jgi:predicted transcriptional regulator